MIGKVLPQWALNAAIERFVYRPRIRALGIDRGVLPLFDGVFFEVRTKCNGRCSFCAASVQNDSRADTSMEPALYEKVIDQLGELGYRGRLAYHVNNDPLLFAGLEEFVAYARAHVPGAWIQILTNGKALSSNRAESLVKAGINELSINLYLKEEEEGDVARFEEIREQVLPKYYRREDILTGHRRTGMSPETFNFNVIESLVSIEKTSRGGSSPNRQADRSRWRGFCDRPWTQFNITADGRVNKCCADFHFADVMGNVKEQSVMDIWQGDTLGEVRRKLLAGDRGVLACCRDCDYLGVSSTYSSLGKKIRNLAK